ncbi:MAG: hypothetical protein ACK40Z_01590 [Dietzia sp.]
MNGPGGPDGGRGAGRSWVYPAIAVVVVVGVLVVVITTVALMRAHDDTPPEVVATPTSPSTTETSTRVSRTSTTVPDTTVVAGPAAVCDAGVINTDLGYPGSGARIIDCGGGWAVMASEISGDPFWVVFRNGRWRPADGVSIYTMTCPDEAIAMGAPAWMAREHLLTCRTSMTSAAAPTARASTTVPTTLPTTIRPTTTLPTTTLPATSRAQTSGPTSMPATSQAPTAAPSDTSTPTGGSATAAVPRGPGDDSDQ